MLGRCTKGHILLTGVMKILLCVAVLISAAIGWAQTFQNSSFEVPALANNEWRVNPSGPGVYWT